MAKDVKCEVDTCSYWSQGNGCHADSVYVVNHATQTANNSGETDCKTFQAKGSM